MDKSKGFTLIELLVVISIIALLSSVVMSSLNTARAKARDARKIQDFRQITLALQQYYDSYGTMPPNPGVLPDNPLGDEVCDGEVGYSMVMQPLINARFLSSLPRSPGGAGYCYYNYGSGNNIGALMVTTLEAAPNSTTGLSPSCRPFPTTNWCNSNSSKQYCMCNPY